MKIQSILQLSIKAVCLFTFILSCIGTAVAQKDTLFGRVVDASDGTPLPYASINIKKQRIGSMTSQDGSFDITFDGQVEGDSILFSYLGYDKNKLALSGLQDSIVVKMQVQPTEIAAVEVYPKPPVYYVKRALKKKYENSPQEEYNTYAYFKQDFYENNDFINKKEFYLKSFYGKDVDTSTTSINSRADSINHFQILLYREDSTNHELGFGAKKRAKKEKKAIKKAKRKGEAYENNAVSANNMVDSLFGGPKMILGIGSANDVANEEVNSKLLEKLDFSFSDKTNLKTYVIVGISKNEFRGKPTLKLVYHIDTRTDAIIAEEIYVNNDIPLLLKPILFAMGVGVESIGFKFIKRSVELDGKWYPNNVTLEIDISATKKYLWRKNEHSDFHMEQLLSHNKIVEGKGSMIPKNLRYSTKKAYKNQVHNTGDYGWSDINVIR